MRWRIAGLALLAAATASGPTAAGAAGQGPHVVVEKASAFPVAAAGGTAYMKVVVTNVGRAESPPGRVAISLIAPGGEPRRLKATGTEFPARDPGRSRTVEARAQLPPSVRAGTRVRLRGCVARSCRAVGEVLVAGPTSLQLIDTAETTGIAFAGDATVLRMQAAWSDPQLPQTYRVRNRALDDHAAVVEAAAAFSRLSTGDRDRVLPYFLPKLVRDALGAPARADAAPDPCAAVADAWKGALPGVHGIAAAGGRVMVWHAPGQAAGARRYARAFDEAWPKLTRAFRAPLLGRGGCVPSRGHLNVFVEPRGSFLSPTAGVTVPTPGWTGREWRVRCTRTPTFIEIEDGAPRVVVPHELMHAIQFAYRYRYCRDLVPTQDRWWDEGGAAWAGDFVYPRDDYEHLFTRAFTANSPIWAESYAAWPFWYFLTQRNGTAVMKRIFERLAVTRVRTAVNDRIPGGYARQYPTYLRWLHNAPPVGEPGFPLQVSFAGLDGLSLQPRVAVERTLSLDGLPERTVVTRALDPRDARYCSPLEVVGSFSVTCDPIADQFAPQMREYQHFTITDPNLRELRFENGLAGQPNERIEAWLKLGDGSWRTADWTGPTTTLCREAPGEDASEVWVVETNAGVKGDGFPARGLRNRLTGRDQCALTSFEGTFSGTAHVVNETQDTTATFHGTLRLDPAGTPVAWVIGPSSLTVDSMTGTVGSCTASVDPADFAMPAAGQDAPVMQRASGEYTLSAGAPQDAQLTVHLAGEGCQDATLPLTQFVTDIARSEAPVAPQADGTIAGGGTIAPADGVSEELSWSLAPLP